MHTPPESAPHNFHQDLAPCNFTKAGNELATGLTKARSMCPQQLTLERGPCGTCVNGVLFMWTYNYERSNIERCDECGIHASDTEAAQSLWTYLFRVTEPKTK